jgi:DNA end-binding protein Ku
MPTRATLTSSLVLGMVAIPIEIYAATEESSVRRSRYVRGTDHPVGQKLYDKETGENVEMAQVMSCVTASDGSIVEITDDEISAAVAAAEEFDPDTIKVLGFFPMLDLYTNFAITEKVYQARPARTKKGRTKVTNKAAAKAFTLLLQGMSEAGTVALVQFTMRGKPRYGALTPAGDFLALRYDEEIRTQLPMPEAPPISETERKMMGQLIANATIELPVLTDRVSAQVEAYADAKAAAGDAFTVATPVAVATEVEEELDLTALLGSALAAQAA